MGRFIKTIKLENKLQDFFLSFLLKEQYHVPFFTKNQESLVSNISGLFMMSGLFLNACDFNTSHRNLVQQLKSQKKNQILRTMVMLNDLQEIACRLNDSGIEFVVLKGWALNADGIYERGLRMSRDIDLLVREDMLDEAFKELKSLGFNYCNKFTEDKAKYLYGRHFPPMINKNNTKLELHWRVTNSEVFKECPITEIMLNERRISRIYPQIYCPSLEATLAHIVHHGFVAHQMSLGPLVLSDLKAIFVFFDKAWPIDENLLKNLKIQNIFDRCKRLIELLICESRFSDESRMLIGQIFHGSLWLEFDDNSNITESLIEDVRIEIVKKNDSLNFIQMIRNMRHQYQVTYFSIKFYYLLMRHGCRFFKKLVRQKI